MSRLACARLDSLASLRNATRDQQRTATSTLSPSRSIFYFAGDPALPFLNGPLHSKARPRGQNQVIATSSTNLDKTKEQKLDRRRSVRSSSASSMGAFSKKKSGQADTESTYTGSSHTRSASTMSRSSISGSSVISGSSYTGSTHSHGGMAGEKSMTGYTGSDRTSTISSGYYGDTYSGRQTEPIPSAPGAMMTGFDGPPGEVKQERGVFAPNPSFIRFVRFVLYGLTSLSCLVTAALAISVVSYYNQNNPSIKPSWGSLIALIVFGIGTPGFYFGTFLLTPRLFRYGTFLGIVNQVKTELLMLFAIDVVWVSGALAMANDLRGTENCIWDGYYHYPKPSDFNHVCKLINITVALGYTTFGLATLTFFTVLFFAVYILLHLDQEVLSELTNDMGGRAYRARTAALNEERDRMNRYQGQPQSTYFGDEKSMGTSYESDTERGTQTGYDSRTGYETQTGYGTQTGTGYDDRTGYDSRTGYDTRSAHSARSNQSIDEDQRTETGRDSPRITHEAEGYYGHQESPFAR
ncbi:uncharacterized protein L969DRAFT_96413 [Mixia osmundae IAM 14324]|uniref:uncharacterized protein n=1 Tax=Mixia osmundae (strain CBS 9802 / IAM 14324 / JCM 22182 / KY 12970) TaxID=764103 RepID=UPI0004A55762|nr:uncharacterized protein L969DRAFT_96413 [Mixia osmundae IAM 14324]KEI37333.1 hypothetical protein L969DRAFT_96413 [Mixia osmundae IAM 14324]